MRSEQALIDGLLVALEALAAGLDERASVKLGIGDDCAVVAPSAGEFLLLETDDAVENVHFSLEWLSHEQAGFRAAVQGLSDIAAMGGEARYILLSLGLPQDIAMEEAVAVASGVAKCAQPFGALVVGGNVTRSPSGLRIGVSVVGESVGGRYVSRSGAQVGEKLYVTGTPGLAAAGLAVLERREDQALHGVTNGENVGARAGVGEQAIARFLHPTPRIPEGQALMKMGATAMIDISDGLAGDLVHLARASGCALVLEAGFHTLVADLLPLAEVLGLAPEALALSPGDDYELACTGPCGLERAALSWESGCGLRAIGAVEAGEGVWFVDAATGTKRRVEAEGFDHFRGL